MAAPDGLPEAETLRRMFAGTVHNLGNIVTVARLAVNELNDDAGESAKMLEMVRGEMLPTLEAEVSAGRIAEFLTENPVGREYVSALRDLLAMQCKLVNDQQATVDNLGKKLEHLSQLLALEQQLLTGLGQPELVSFARLADDALILMQEALVRHGVQVQRQYASHPQVQVEPGLVVQVFVNLIKNAVEALDEVHARPRQLTLAVTLDQTAPLPMATCALSDNGPGIAASVLPRLFEFGFTTKGQRHGGQGVGLHYCRRTLEKYRGTIAVQSVFGHGATFTFALPAVPGAGRS